MYNAVDPYAETKKLKSKAKKRRIGAAMSSLGYHVLFIFIFDYYSFYSSFFLTFLNCHIQAKYPVIIVPGIASSALEAWNTDDSAWHRFPFFFYFLFFFFPLQSFFRERVWIDPFKVGKTAGLQKIAQFVNQSSRKEPTSNPNSEEGEEEDGMDMVQADVRKDIDQVFFSFFLKFILIILTYDKMKISQAKKAQTARKWLKYMMLDPSDGVTDPPG